MGTGKMQKIFIKPGRRMAVNGGLILALLGFIFIVFLQKAFRGLTLDSALG